jgi:hypothetical protein
VLDAAYDDPLGVTAAFNLNLLRHLNHLAGADFDVAQWKHVAYFDFEHSRIEMHLERAAAHRALSGGERRFERGERIHTENSYKYTRQSFTTLLERAGFATTRTWTDDDQWFAVIHAASFRIDDGFFTGATGGAQAHAGADRTAVRRRLRRAIDAGRQPDQVAPGAHHVVLRDLHP